MSKKVVKKPNKETLVVIGIALLVVLLFSAGGVYYFLFREKPAAIKQDESVSGQLDSLTDQDIRSLANSSVDATTNFAGAHAKAMALWQKGDYAASAAAYKTLVDTGKASHEVYVEYAAALYYSGDKQGGIKAMETAIEKVKASNTTQADKDSILKVYNNQLSGYKDEAAS